MRPQSLLHTIRNGRRLATWLTLLWSFTLVGCLKEETLVTVYQPRLVVEGRIEQGRPAEVMLTLNKAFDEAFREEELQQIVVRWAKMTVSCGDESEVLTGRYNTDYPTRFIYSGSSLRGEVGKSYTLRIDYGGGTWQAVTTIPEPHQLLNLRTEKSCDTLYRIRATLPPNAKKDPLLVECAIGDERWFRPALLGILGGEDGGQVREITINRPLDYTRITDYTTQFRLNEQVHIRLATTTPFGYDYWSSWENNTVNSLNPIFPARMNLPTNLTGDAIGIWCGYGSTYYRISFPISE